MPCAVFSDPKLFGGAQIIQCGPGINPKPLKCATCGAPTNNLCDWKTEKRVKIHPAQLRLGDIYETHGKQHLCVEVVSRFQRWFRNDGYPGFLQKVTMFGVTYKSGVSFLFYRTNRERIPVLRKVLCSAPCCWRHSRHVGPNVHYCQAHWRDGERIA